MPQTRLEREALMAEDGAPPPRIRRARNRILIVAAGLLAAAMLLVVVFNIEKPAPVADDLERFGELKELVTPAALTIGDIAPDRSASGDAPPIDIKGGGWIQVTDPDGRLVQQYRFERLDPAPADAGPGWIRMNRPNAQIYLSGNRVLTLEGEAALAYRPSRVLESGTITGEVVIRLYEAPDDARTGALTPENLQLVVKTSEARFDSVLGEIHCANDVAVATRMGDFVGRDLRLQINERQNRIQYLAVTHPGPIRISGSALSNRSRADRIDAPSQPAAAATSSTPAPVATAPVAEVSSPTAEPPPAFQPYLLTLHDDVRVTQGDQTTGRLSTGDLLTLLFSLESKPAGRTGERASTPPQPTGSSRAADRAGSSTPVEPPPVSSTAAPISDRDPDDISPPRDPAGDIVVTCSGRLEMAPVTDLVLLENFHSVQDALLELTGDPVTLTDYAEASQATCNRLRYNVLFERSELFGEPQRPVRLAAPQFEAEGRALWITHRENRAGFDGAGWLATEPASPGEPQPLTPGAAKVSPKLHVSWDRSVDLQFQQTHAAEKRTSLKQAVFRGDVDVLSDELVVNSETLDVRFLADGPAPNTVESIEASGAVRARSTTQSGQISGDRIQVALVQDADGRTIPATMTATGNVEAADDEKTIWADSVLVTFRTDGADALGAAEAPHAAEGPGAQTAWLNNAKVRTVLAEGNVQTAMSAGTRVFADRIFGQVEQRTLMIAGQPVLMTHDQLVFERDTSVTITEARPGYFRVEGPGKARLYPQPIQGQIAGRAPRPQIPGNPELLATWSDWLVYDSNADEARQASGGTITFHGKVDALATPSSLKRDSIKADELVLGLEAPPADADAKKAAARAPTSAAAAGRRIRTLTADGDAELESRTWLNADRSDKPRVFHLAGPHVEYDDRTGEALVVGANKLLIRDERPSPVRSEQAVVSEQSAFSGKGTTEFRSAQQLHMTRQNNDLFTVDFTGEVEVRHLSIDDRTATLSCDNLQAAIRRPDLAAAPSAETRETKNSFDLGGEAELRSLKADGKVYISTPTRKVECDLFAYDYSTGVAEVAARPGRRASILAVYEGAQPISIERALWNLQTDAVNIIGASGSLNR